MLHGCRWQNFFNFDCSMFKYRRPDVLCVCELTSNVRNEKFTILIFDSVDENRIPFGTFRNVLIRFFDYCIRAKRCIEANIDFELEFAFTFAFLHFAITIPYRSYECMTWSFPFCHLFAYYN